ncbi:hypothetical protein AB0C08_29160 [Microbispora bryophytorum]|uniref:hypothetical protein n=1 Tax=Microbispora bryophytorum TaxID=1460882 RepID=UPI0033C760E8
MSGGAGGDFLGGDVSGGAQDVEGAVVLAPGEECAGGVEEDGRLALVDGQGVDVDPAGVLDRGSRVAE